MLLSILLRVNPVGSVNHVKATHRKTDSPEDMLRTGEEKLSPQRNSVLIYPKHVILSRPAFFAFLMKVTRLSFFLSVFLIPAKNFSMFPLAFCALSQKLTSPLPYNFSLISIDEYDGMPNGSLGP